MPLLGNGFDDPQSGAITALSAGLLGRNFAGGLLGAQNAYAQAKQAQTRAAMEQMQMDVAKEELAMKRKQFEMAAAKDDEVRDFWRKIGGAGPAQPASYSPGQLGSGFFGVVSNPAPMRPATAGNGPASGGGLQSLTPEDIAYAKSRLGMDLIEPWKVAKQGFEQKAGTFRVDPRTNQREYIPDPKEGIGFNGGVVSNLPGYVESQAQRTIATELPKAIIGSAGRVNLRTLPDGTQVPVSELTENPMMQDYMRMVFGGTPIPSAASRAPAAAMPSQTEQRGAQPVASGGMRVTPDAQRVADQEAIRVIRSELANTTDPQTKAGLERELARFESAQSMPGFPTATARVTPAGQGRYGKTTAQETQDAAKKEYAVGVAKDVVETRKSIMDAGRAATKTIAKYQQLGGLLEGVDGGVLTPMGTNLASMANSFGLKIDKNLPNKEAAAALANEIALEMRNPANGAGMPGAMSDKDREFLVSLTPNAGQTAQGRKMIVNSAIAIAQRNQQVAEFARKYEQKYGQLDNGFFTQLSAWSDANPLFKAK